MQDNLNIVLRDTYDLLTPKEHEQINNLWKRPELQDSIRSLADWASLQDGNAEQRKFALEHAARLVTTALTNCDSIPRTKLRELLEGVFEQRLRFTAKEMSHVLGAGTIKAVEFPNPKDAALVQNLSLRDAYGFSTLSASEQQRVLKLAKQKKKSSQGLRGLTGYLIDDIKRQRQSSRSKSADHETSQEIPALMTGTQSRHQSPSSGCPALSGGDNNGEQSLVSASGPLQLGMVSIDVDAGGEEVPKPRENPKHPEVSDTNGFGPIPVFPRFSGLTEWLVCHPELITPDFQITLAVARAKFAKEQGVQLPTLENTLAAVKSAVRDVYRRR
jgi:hypothetical protein